MARLLVRLTPKAVQERIDGWDVDEYGRAVVKIRVRAAPIEGRANEALIVFVAQKLGIPKSRIGMASGETSRLKTLEVDGLDEADLRARLS